MTQFANQSQNAFTNRKSSPIVLITSLIFLLSALQGVLAVDKEGWRTRSIYQLITDRFAPPSSSAPALTDGLSIDGKAACPPGSQQWCGGTWRSIVDKLDYIQGMGFDAVWISPTSKNIDTNTPYGAAYHGYWVQDPLTLNPRFGSADDLKFLSAELHKRNMLLMVDIVVNNVVALHEATIKDTIDKNPDIRWRKEEMFHTYCPVDYNNVTSELVCWMGDDKLALPDVNTENTEVISTLQTWIKDFVTTYNVDGLRIDAAKHVRPEFWQPFCAAAGVFCMGEVYGDDIPSASAFQSLGYLDSILNFVSYFAASDAFFEKPNQTLNMSRLVDRHTQVQQAFPDVGLLGSFLGNHDLPRYHGLQVDPRTAWNALVWQFMSDGIPTVFYGDEQDIGGGALAGHGDPANRPALWADGNGDYSTDAGTYKNIKQLNAVRKYLIASNAQNNGKTFLGSKLEFVSSSANDMAFRKGPVLVALTNRGSPSQSVSIGLRNTGFNSQAVNILECTTFPLGSNDSLLISYNAAGAGGKPYVFMSYDDAAGTGLCPNIVAVNTTARTQNRASNKNAHTNGDIMVTHTSVITIAFLTTLTVLFGMMS